MLNNLKTMTLFDIVGKIYLESQIDDSIFRNKPRFLMNLYAKEGMKKLNLTFGIHIKGINATIPSSCRLYKPEGYETFIRAYLINCDGRTIEIVHNNRIPSEILTYLTECDGSLITGCDEENVSTNCLECNNDGRGCQSDDCDYCGGTGYCLGEAQQMIADLEAHKDSWIKEQSDYFEFSSDLEDMAVVIEYISNQTAGIEECMIEVDDKVALALEYYIKFRLLESGEQTMNQAQYFRKMFKSTRDSEVVKSNPLTKTDILSTLLF